MKLITLLLMTVGACTYAPIVPDPVNPATDGTCASYCHNAADLGCSFAQPTKAGTSCEDVCLNATKFVKWDLTCRTIAGTCNAIDACER